MVSLFEKTLADDWAKLPAVIRRHYDIYSGNHGKSCVYGKLNVYFPMWITPLVKLIHCFGGLIDQRGDHVSTRVEKWVSEDNKILYWHRHLDYPEGKTVIFKSTMTAISSHQLIEWVRFGFGLKLTVREQHGQLVYQSNGHVWQCAGLRIVFPDWLLLGHATIKETTVSDAQFKLDFKIQHPLWGLTYAYQGEFTYV